MALIDFYIRNQKLSKNGPAVVAGSIKYVDCSFTFKTSDWEGLDKWMILEKGDEIYRVNLQNDAVPKETGLSIGEGIWHVSLFGEGADGTRITTDSVTVEVEKSAASDGELLPVIEQTEAEQIAAKAQEALEKAAEAIEKANAVFEAAAEGDFDGEDGEDGFCPEKGKDYWTDEDKKEIIDEVSDEMEGKYLPLAGGTVRGVSVFNKYINMKGGATVGSSVDFEDIYGSSADVSVYNANGEIIMESAFGYPVLRIGEPGNDYHAATKKYVDEAVKNFQPDEGGSGEPGKDGFSPLVEITEIEGGHNVKITDAGGEKSFDVMDGDEGAPGKDGKSYEIWADEFDDGVEITIMDTDTEEENSFFIKHGKDGEPGSAGAPGNGISAAVLNADYTLTLTFDNGTKYTTPSIRGAAGTQGPAYTLTAADKSEMINAVIAALPKYDGSVV